jgi:MFS family permease
LFSDVLINELRFGRRGAIIVSAVSVILAAIFGSATQKTWQFALTRVLLGFGMGCKASVVPVFAAEIAPPHLRGELPILASQMYGSV